MDASHPGVSGHHEPANRGHHVSYGGGHLWWSQTGTLHSLLIQIFLFLVEIHKKLISINYVSKVNIKSCFFTSLHYKNIFKDASKSERHVILVKDGLSSNYDLVQNSCLQPYKPVTMVTVVTGAPHVSP